MEHTTGLRAPHVRHAFVPLHAFVLALSLKFLMVLPKCFLYRTFLALSMTPHSQTEHSFLLHTFVNTLIKVHTQMAISYESIFPTRLRTSDQELTYFNMCP